MFDYTDELLDNLISEAEYEANELAALQTELLVQQEAVELAILAMQQAQDSIAVTMAEADTLIADIQATDHGFLIKRFLDKFPYNSASNLTGIRAELWNTH